MNAKFATTTRGKYTATCKLCQLKADFPALNLPTIGETGKPEKEMMLALTKHLGKHHPTEFTEGASLLDETYSFLVLAAFEHQDPSIQPRLEAIRARIFAKVRKITFDDDNIQQLVGAMGFEPDDWEKVTAAMRALRDACCELGPYAPKVPADSKLIQV